MKLKTLKKLARQLSYCSLCSNCSATCCSFKAFGWESYTPRARMMLAKYYAEGVFIDEEALAARMFNCSMCAECSETCPAPMDPREVFQSARVELFEKGKAPAPVAAVNEAIKACGNPFSFNPASRDAWTRDVQGQLATGGKNLLFQGCIPAYKNGAYLQKLARIYATMGMPLSVIPGNEETCCGLPSLDSGNVERFNDLARRNIEKILALNPVRIVFACPSCYSFVKEHYGKENEAFGKLELAFYTDDLMNGVNSGALELQGFERETTVAYHDPCHLGRFSRLWDSPRAIIKAIPNVKFVDMLNSKEMTSCCGSGGEWLVVNPGATRKVADKRIEEVMETQASYLVNTCFTCQDTLQGAAFRVAGDLEVMHVLDFFK